MKVFIFFCTLMFPGILQAQFVVGSQGMAIQAGAIVAIDSMVMQPSALLTITSNQLVHSNTSYSGSVQRIYSFSSPINYSGTIGFFYADNELNANLETSLQIVTSASVNGVWVTTTGSAVNTGSNFVSKILSNTLISRVTASSGANPLPLELLLFNAQKNDANHSVLLEWEVQNEVNIERYDVERSTNGKDFTAIGATAAKQENKYHYMDVQPADGDNYYRLKIIEQGGEESYSQVRQVYFGLKLQGIEVWPNPVVTSVTIHSTSADIIGTQGVILKANGSIFMTFSLTSKDMRLDASSWPVGIYLIKLSTGKVFKIEKR